MDSEKKPNEQLGKTEPVLTIEGHTFIVPKKAQQILEEAGLEYYSGHWQYVHNKYNGDAVPVSDQMVAAYLEFTLRGMLWKECPSAQISLYNPVHRKQLHYRDQADDSNKTGKIIENTITEAWIHLVCSLLSSGPPLSQNESQEWTAYNVPTPYGREIVAKYLKGELMKEADGVRNPNRSFGYYYHGREFEVEFIMEPNTRPIVQIYERLPPDGVKRLVLKTPLSNVAIPKEE